MAHSTLIPDEDTQPVVDLGHGNRALGPGDISDTGSDRSGLPEMADADAAGTGERAAAAGTEPIDGADIGVDRVVPPDEAGATWEDERAYSRRSLEGASDQAGSGGARRGMDAGPDDADAAADASADPDDEDDDDEDDDGASGNDPALRPPGWRR